MFANKRKSAAQRIGCGFLLGTGAVVLTLLVLNNLFVRTFFGENLTGLDERIFQAAQFVLPIVMIFVQFWFYDWWTMRRK